jgi:hypothetical protein
MKRLSRVDLYGYVFVATVLILLITLKTVEYFKMKNNVIKTQALIVDTKIIRGKHTYFKFTFHLNNDKLKPNKIEIEQDKSYFEKSPYLDSIYVCYYNKNNPKNVYIDISKVYDSIIYDSLSFSKNVSIFEYVLRN